MLKRFFLYQELLYKGKTNPFKLSRMGFRYSKTGRFYYVHDYYSKSANPDKYEDDIETHWVLGLKNKNKETISHYSYKIAKFISCAVPDGRDYIVLAVPSSDKGSKSCMEYCIERIRKHPEIILNKNIHMLEDDYALTRIDSVNKSHKSLSFNRPSRYEHIRTIGYKKHKPLDPICNAVVILIDDIATTGTTINACKRRLMCSNIKSKNIIKLVMARTVYNKEKQ